MRMRNLSRTCLILCACCIIALRALAIRERDEDNKATNETDDFDFELFDDEDEDDADENLDDDVEELGGHTKGKAVAAAVKLPRRRLEPEAEMLPANYEGVKPPGVDHMEMTREGPFYNCRIAYQSDHDKVMNFMKETYLKSEPSIVNIGNGLAEHTPPVLINLMRMNIQEGMTIIIEDTLYNCVVGAAVNVELHPHDPDKTEKIANCCDCKPARDLIKFYAFCSRQSDLWNVFCVPAVFECAHVAVHPDHQGKGLAKKLIEESWILARDTAYRVFRIDCSSVYTAQIAEGFSWKNIYSIPYRRYFHEGDFVFKCIQEPHTEMRIFVDQINQYTRYHPIYKCKRK